MHFRVLHSGDPGTSSAGPFGVIDIGSHSVRLMIYACLSRSPLPVYNEKIMAGLGRGLDQSGLLNRYGVERTLQALARFVALGKTTGVTRMEIIATAAVREARNGSGFIADLEALAGQKVRVLSGGEEATCAAMGVLAGIPEASGFVGDLGGGSLELIPVDAGDCGKGLSLPLGVLRLEVAAGESRARANEIIMRELARVPWLKDMRNKPLYVVGGTWRNLARIHMARTRYPVAVLHQYRIEALQARNLATLVEGEDPKSLSRIPNVSARRIPTLLYGALVLDNIMTLSQASCVVVSSHGLREGLLYGALGKEERGQDPLIEGCRELAGRLTLFSAGNRSQYEKELFDWTENLFSPETPEKRRWRKAACILADIGRDMHRDHRAQHVMEQILLAPFSGIDHAGRVFLARAGFHRHQGGRNPGGGTPPNRPGLDNFLSPDDIQRAKSLGLAMRLAFALCAGKPGLLCKSSLFPDQETLYLKIPADLHVYAGETVKKRLDSLARSLGRKAQLQVSG